MCLYLYYNKKPIQSFYNGIPIMKTIITILLFVGITFTLTTCTQKASDPSVCFGDNILPIFVSKCSTNGCHENFTTYDGIIQQVIPKHPLQSNIYTKIDGANPSMPPKGYMQLTAQEKFMIKAWISMGALNQSHCMVCDTASFKFTADVQPILNSWCVGCHNSSTQSGGTDLSNYNGIVNSIANNQLLGTIKYSSGYNAMPQNGNQLSGCQISKIQSWINAGHPNN